MKTVQAQNVNHPEHRQSLNEEKYEIIRAAMLHALPQANNSEGMLFTELEDEVRGYLNENNVPTNLFPKPGSVRWYTKAVQLDLEAKGEIERLPDLSPIRLRKCNGY